MLGRLCKRQGRVDQAIARYEEARKIMPQPPQAIDQFIDRLEKVMKTIRTQ